jgi:fructokinase
MSKAKGHPLFDESHGKADNSRRWLGAVEGGGTKFLCAVGTGPNNIVDERRIETRDPVSTLADVVAFFAGYPICALGVGTFGPLELRSGPHCGAVLTTPKPGWAGFHFRRYLEKHFSIPIAIDTDVNAAALGEARYGAAQGDSVVLYVTVGTGVGGGVLVDGNPLHGLLHPEFGHIPMPVLRDRSGNLDTFAGSCPYHGRCLEGLISGPALLRRTGIQGEKLSLAHEAFDWAARYLGIGLATAVTMLSPSRIIVGGGVMREDRLLPRVRYTMRESLAGYIPRPELTSDAIEKYVVEPALGARSGLLGAFVLAARAFEERARKSRSEQ